ncbi:IclR family transcriptional regulator [Corynebacterium afermentans]|uniref:IclR family transcriptional regulator n=1 Tax=Corynebacterium afermentans TaxID=38286 RepID=UPI002572895C|nr:IclR family transcriptional regulator [Corynebacterium afermentans]MCG7272738.1 IclR family transcriptional regulator [Corynebacterium afermentans]
MRQYNEGSGIKVLDRAVTIVAAVASGDKSLAELSDATELPRATAHRIATALEVHHVLARNERGEWSLGPALPSYTGGPSPRLLAAAAPVLRSLVEATGESAQLYQLTGTTRTCIAAEEPESGLHNVVPVGSHLTLTAGSAARVFAAYAPVDAPFKDAELKQVRDDGFAESVAEREIGLASVSTPVFQPDGALVAVLSISGPAERLKPSPADKWGKELLAARKQLEGAL